MRVPKKGGKVIITVRDEDKGEIIGIARSLENMGVEILATAGTATALKAAGIDTQVLRRASEPSPNILDRIQQGDIDMIINTPSRRERGNDTDGFHIRRYAVEHSVLCVTSVDTARACVTARKRGKARELVPIDISKLD